MDADGPNPESLNRRIKQLEQRVAVLEHRSPGTRLRRREVPGGIRAFRAPLAVLGVLLLLFGGLITDSFLGPLLGVGLLLFAFLVNLFVPARYIPAPASDIPAVPSPGSPVPETGSMTPPRRSGTVEADIGKRIFAWVGITALLIGITLFIGYSFQNFGTAGKLGVGYASAAALLLVGRRLRRGFRAYSYVLEGGGWAAIYFVTYALSFVPQVQVIDSSLVTLGLLLMVIAVMAAVSIRERSPGFTAGAFALGYFTAIVGAPFGNFTLWSTLFLSLGTLLVALRLRWFVFGLVGTVATYLAAFAWEVRLLDGTPTHGDYLTGAFFLILYGWIYGIGHVLTPAETAEHRNSVTTGVGLNVALSFTAAVVLFRDAGVAVENVALIYTGILAIFYGLTHVVPMARHLRSTYLVLTVAAGTLYLALALAGSDLTMAWVIEGAALVAVGILTKNRTLRVLGYLVALLGSLLVVRDVTVGSIPTNAFDASPERQPVIAMLATGVWLGVSYLVHRSASELPEDERALGYAFGDVGVVFTVLVLQSEVTANLVSIATGLLGLTALAFGFVARSPHARLLGIAVIGFTVVRVFLFDVAGLDAFGKMLSFLGLGALLLLVAYVYNRSRSMRSEEPESRQ